MASRALVLACIIFGALISLTLGQLHTTSPTSLRIHFVYGGNISDYAINFAMERGRVAAVDTLLRNRSTFVPILPFLSTFRLIMPVFASAQILGYRLLCGAFPIETQLVGRKSMYLLPDVLIGIFCPALDFVSSFSVADEKNIATSFPTNAHYVIITDSTLAGLATAFAPQFPGIKFILLDAEHDEGLTSNVLVVRPRWYRGLYLAGYVCAMASSNGRIGLVLPDPKHISMVLYANAFYVGVKHALASAEVGMALVDHFNASVASKAAAHSLLDWGATCVTAVQGNAVAYQVFRDAKLPSVGFASNVRVFTGDSVWTSFLIDSSSTFEYLLSMILAQTWQPGQKIYPLSQTERGDWGLYVARPVRTLIDHKLSSIVNNASVSLFCKDEYTSLGITFPPNVSVDCPPLSDYFDPSLMRLTPNMPIVANWTTDSATRRIYWRYNAPISITVLTISSVFAAFCVYLIWHIVYWRESRVYAAVSWLVILMIPISSLIMLASIVPALGIPSPASCHLRVWLESFGTLFLMGPILARNFKLYMWKKRGLTVLTKEYEERFVVSAYELFAMWLAPLVLAELAILTFYSSLTPLVAKFSEAPFLPFGSVESECYESVSRAPQYVWYAFHVSLALVNLVFLYVLKNIPLLGAEAISAGAIVLNTVVLGGLTAFVATVVGRALVTTSLVVWLKFTVAAVAVIVIVVPKWWAVQIKGVKEPLDVIEPSNQTESSAVSSAPHYTKKPREPIPEFYSESSEASPSTTFEDDDEDEDEEQDAEDDAGDDDDSEANDPAALAAQADPEKAVPTKPKKAARSNSTSKAEASDGPKVNAPSTPSSRSSSPSYSSSTSSTTHPSTQETQLQGAKQKSTTSSSDDSE